VLEDARYSEETNRVRLSVFVVCLLAIMLTIFLIDDPSFDLFEDKHYTVVDEDYLQNQKIKQAKRKAPKSKANHHKEHHKKPKAKKGNLL
jgi:hypothetical protein